MKQRAFSPYPFDSLFTFQRAETSSAAQMAESSDKQEGEFSEQLVGDRARPVVRSRRAYPLTHFEFGALLGIFFSFVVAILCIYFTMPGVNHKRLKLPRTVAELRALTDYISSYTDEYKPQVLLGFCVTYIFMQTFMIPGTIVMSLLAGSLFGAAQGVMLVVFNVTAGASCCFFLSKLIGRPLALWMWPEKLRFFSGEVAKRREYLFNYMLFLRITPTLPNTFINVCSPIVDIPFRTFLPATVIGVIPATFITVRAGLAMHKLNSFKELYDLKTVAALFFIGLLSIVPTLLAKSPSTNRPSPTPTERPHTS